MVFKHSSYSKVHYVNAVIETKQLYMNCDIIAVIIGIILSIMRHILSNAQKHNS